MRLYLNRTSNDFPNSVLSEVAGMAEWLDHLNLVQRVPGLKPPSDLSQSVRRELANPL